VNDKTLDCSDIDQYLGKPIQPARMKEAIHNNDIRRWAQAMHYPNLLAKAEIERWWDRR